MIVLKISEILTTIPLICFGIAIAYRMIQSARQKSVKKYIMAIIIAASGCLILNQLCNVLLRVVEVGITPDRQPYVRMLLGRNMCNIFIYIMYIGYKLYSERKDRKRFAFVSLITCISVVVQVSFYYYLFLLDPADFTELLLGVTNISIFFILFVHSTILELMDKIMTRQEKQNETEKKMLEKKYEYDYYLLAQEQSEAIQEIRSEMWEQLETVQKYIQTKEEDAREEAQNMLGQLEQKVNKLGRVYYCEDPILNTILSLKQERARKQGIDMNILVDSTIQTEVEDIDLCCIVTNLLDNAIESAMNMKEEKENEDTDIRVRVGRRGGYLVMKVENPTIAMPEKNRKGAYLSTKKDDDKNRAHGRGLNIVEKTVQKYGGYMDFKVEDQKVTSTVFLQEKSGQPLSEAN